jgi:3-oxosteroid 1-dehydrogenase
MVGGGMAYGGGVSWIPCTHLEAEAGIEDSIDSAERYLDRFSHNDDVKLRRAWLRSGPVAIEWFARSAGIPWELAPAPDDESDDPDGLALGRFVTMAPVPGASLGQWRDRTRISPLFPPGVTMAELHELASNPDHLRALVSQRASEDPRTFGAGVAAGFVRAALTERRIAIELQTRVTELIQADGAVVGARAVGAGGDALEVRAIRGVLIAAGSYGNADYAASFERLPDLVELTPPLSHGDNLSLSDPTAAAQLIGEAVSILPGYQVPGETHPGSDEPLYRATPNLSWRHAILVNRRGQRFGDEMFHGPELAAHTAVDPRTGEWVNFPSFLVCDDRLRRTSSLPPFEAGDDWPAELGAHAETLAELAQRAGIDAEGLVATVKRFNGFATEGIDHDFGRGRIAMGRRFGDESLVNPNLSPLSEPPFWAIPLRLAGGGNYSLGVAIDGNGQAVTRHRTPVPGLYVTGNSAARMEVMRHHTGTTDSRTIVWAFNAASHAAGVPTLSDTAPAASATS